jgi:hypothetical protein
MAATSGLCHDWCNTLDPKVAILAHGEKEPASTQRGLALTVATLAAGASKFCREVLARPCSVLCQ